MKKLLLLFVLLVAAAAAFAQNPLKKLKELGSQKIPGINSVLQGKDPITTTLNDAVYEVPEMDNFEPGFLLPANELPRNADGSFYLFPGVWEFHLKSYCMKAGTYAPSKTSGSGHIYAPLLGPKADIMQSLLKNGFRHPEINQRDIQVLIWAIIAKQNLKDMPKEYMLTAAKLLESSQMLRLNDGVVKNFSQKEFLKLTNNLPEPVRQVLEAENKMRGMLTDANNKYEDFERVAVLTGIMPEDEGRKITKGRWSLTPEGYYIRYFPESYSQMTLQVYVKDENFWASDFIEIKNSSGKNGNIFTSIKVPARKLKEFDPSKNPALPSGRGQRLGSSNDKNNADNRNDALDKANKILSGADNAQTVLGMATDPLGTIVDKANPMSPGNMFGHILTFITDNGRKISDALNGDPPDDDYTSFAVADSFNYGKLKQKAFNNSVLNQYATEFIDSYLVAHSFMLALVKSNDKQGGAKMAKDDFWTNKQAQAIIFYKKKLGDALLVACEKWDRFLTELKARAKSSLELKPEKILAYQNRLRTSGFTETEMATFRFLRMNETEIEKLKSERLSYNANNCSGDYISQSKILLNAWKEYGNVYSRFPAIPAPWE